MGKIENFSDIEKKLNLILEDINNSKNILFAKDIRNSFEEGYKDFKTTFSSSLKNINKQLNENTNKLKNAGLLSTTGQYLLKMKTFELAYEKYIANGGVYFLDKVLEIASIIFGSLGNAIPTIGSFIQEFIDVIRFYLQKHIRNI